MVQTGGWSNISRAVSKHQLRLSTNPPAALLVNIVLSSFFVLLSYDFGVKLSRTLSRTLGEPEKVGKSHRSFFFSNCLTYQTFDCLEWTLILAGVDNRFGKNGTTRGIYASLHLNTKSATFPAFVNHEQSIALLHAGKSLRS